MNAIVSTVLAIAVPLLGQAPADRDEPRDQAAATAALGFMKDSARNYRLHRGDGKGPLRLQDEPAFHLGKQYTGVLDGAIFFWLDNEDRPEAAVQLFKIQNAGAPLGLWISQFSSLSPGSLVAERDGRIVWNPQAPGVDFKPVPGAPVPAESPTQRSRQMRALAQDFRAVDDFQKKGWRELRLLPTPIARYGNGKPGMKVLDGFLFAFVEGTDPEVFLFLEARRLDQAIEWQYALAPMSVFAVKSTYRGKTVWELPDRKPAKDPARPFFDFIGTSEHP